MCNEEIYCRCYKIQYCYYCSCFFDTLAYYKYLNESSESEEKYCYQRIYNILRHYCTIEMMQEKKLKNDVEVEIEKIYTILVNKKQDGFLVC